MNFISLKISLLLSESYVKIKLIKGYPIIVLVGSFKWLHFFFKTLVASPITIGYIVKLDVYFITPLQIVFRDLKNFKRRLVLSENRLLMLNLTNLFIGYSSFLYKMNQNMYDSAA